MGLQIGACKSKLLLRLTDCLCWCTFLVPLWRVVLAADIPAGCKGVEAYHSVLLRRLLRILLEEVGDIFVVEVVSAHGAVLALEREECLAGGGAERMPGDVPREIHESPSLSLNREGATQPYRQQTKHPTPICLGGLLRTAHQMSPKPPSDPAAALLALQQSPSLKILDLAETLSPKEIPQSAQKRNSGVSDDSAQDADVDTNPAALAADLAHYKVSNPPKLAK